MAKKKKRQLTKNQVVAEVKKTLAAAKKLVLELEKVEDDVKGSPFGGTPYWNCPRFSHGGSKRRRG
jgi:hypothetical protein